MKKDYYIGIDLGGTKSAVILIDHPGKILDRQQFPTLVGKNGFLQTLETIKSIARVYVKRQSIKSIGISCGGPLDRKKGLILSPPNLPGWDRIPIVEILTKEFVIPAYLENDANAGALAEWKFGAGKGYKNLIFLTFGTGLGAGLILDGKLYNGTNDLAGEIGHIRLADDGPIGYHKKGSLEGFCSGPGLAQMMAAELHSVMEETLKKQYKSLDKITGRDVVEWAKAGDPLALRVVEKSGTYLGKGLSILIDILNPELIIIGSMGVRLGELLLGPAKKVITREALSVAAGVCKIAPAALGESIGDYAALCVALQEEKLRFH